MAEPLPKQRYQTLRRPMQFTRRRLCRVVRVHEGVPTVRCCSFDAVRDGENAGDEPYMSIAFSLKLR